jgi:FAD/FMN-containing dehydrogenase
MSMKTWSNWSGSLQFKPEKIDKPSDEEDLVKVVCQAKDAGKKVRVVGAGHSSSPLVQTDDILISLEKFQGLVSHNPDKHEATIRSGMTVHDAGQELLKIGLATHNTGDVDVQMLAGAISTGTHGTGNTLKNLSTMLNGVRMVTAQGEIVDYSIEDDPDFTQAARVSLGTLGIFTEIRLGLLPAFKLYRREWCTDVNSCMENLDELIHNNRNFDFYWYPRSDEIKLRTMNEENKPNSLPYAKCVREEEGWSAEILPRKRVLKFDEMEYSLPAEAGPECFQEIRARVKAKHRKNVAWRVLYRTIAADDAYLSTMYGRETVTISLHQNAGLPFWDYFNDIEPIFRHYDGRPHWGKKHNLKAKDLQKLYPMWDKFAEIRQACDPDGLFLSPYMQELLIP